MKRTINIVVTFDLDENHPGGVTITPKEISRELVRKNVAELFIYEEGFQDLTVEVKDEENSLVQCIVDRYGAERRDFMTAKRIE